jgi:hypothetical protein
MLDLPDERLQTDCTTPDDDVVVFVDVGVAVHITTSLVL